MLNTTKKFPNEWRDIVYAFLERLSVVKTSVFSKLICLLLFSHFVLHAKSLQSCLTLCDPMDCSLPPLLCPWDSPGKNTGVGCHALLQGILPIGGLKLCLLWLLHRRQILYRCATREAQDVI